ncbi:PfkB family carbohydrate kinase [Arthrobacter agilis]|uniref:PfkB family carbohydrate kinase n=1 Tax=Arthrobacter agilis TaxID=37921 RepID=UPI002366405A|nr:PfkB family carbohydrate kinase [Arthrobacter agilis]WDF34076.1 PfkB family carbohydrate kinase [Arthrobacter agilis]
MRVLGYGDNIVDRFIDRRTSYPGGNSVNFSVFARRLGASSAYMGVFGDDRFGDLLKESLIAESVDISRSVTRNGPSGWTNIRLQDGERQFLDWNGGGITLAEPLRPSAEDIGYLTGFDVVHSSVYSGIEEHLPALHAAVPRVSFDFSSDDDRRTDAYLAAVCPSVNLAQFSCADLSSRDSRDLLVAAVRHGAGAALATRGTGGAVFFDGSMFHEDGAEPVPPSSIVDTMGCGDAYLTAFLLELLRAGWSRDGRPGAADVAASMRTAALYSARQCTVEGAFGRGWPFSDTDPAAARAALAGPAALLPRYH